MIREEVILMFTIDISLEMLETLLSETKTAGGNALRFHVYDSEDEIPNSFNTVGLLLPSTELPAGEGSFFPGDRT